MSSHLEIAYSSIRVFADDGKVDLGELNFLLGLALRDGEIDDEEKRVLRNIFKQARDTNLSPGVEERIREVENRYGF